MSAPQRIQRRRTQGWRMPANTIYVGRGSRWGNPYIVGKDPIGTGLKGARVAVNAFKEAITRGDELGPRNSPMPTQAEVTEHLAGKNLACWCPLDQPCHADILLTIANPPEGTINRFREPPYLPQPLANHTASCVPSLKDLIDAVNKTEDAVENAWQTFADDGDEGIQDTLGLALARTATTTRLLALACGVDLDRAITSYETIHNPAAPTPTRKDVA